MKTEQNIFVAFILNLLFSVFEFVGGLWIGSVAILSDALHDLGDTMSIGVAWFLERKSKRPPDETHTYGYGRYSVLGGILTSLILLVGSCVMIFNAAKRIINPTPIHYTGMIIFAVIGAAVNVVAAVLTREGESINQRAVNLHMLEDALGWILVLIGAVIMRFTDLSVLDPILSIGLAVFILVNAAKNLKEAADLFLEKTPHGSNVSEIKEHLLHIEGVTDVHHIHVWSLDGQHNFATLHAVTAADPHATKHAIRHELEEHGIGHATIELETESEHCHETTCTIKPTTAHHHHHHHQ